MMEAGTCHRGVADKDTDKDSVIDCNDRCKEDANTTEAGKCIYGVSLKWRGIVMVSPVERWMQR